MVDVEAQAWSLWPELDNRHHQDMRSAFLKGAAFSSDGTGAEAALKRLLGTIGQTKFPMPMFTLKDGFPEAYSAALSVLNPEGK